MKRRPNLAVVGATGAVGSVMLEILSERADRWGEIRPIASARSAGRTVTARGEELPVVALAESAFEGVDIALFDVPDEVSRSWAPVAASRGATVVDNSGAFRMDPDVPLVVPEINPHTAAEAPKGIIASANCTTLALIVPVGALHRAWGLESMRVASYQAASGAGQEGVESLLRQTAAVAADPAEAGRPGALAGLVGDPAPFSEPLALNVVPWAGSLREEGWSSEELKVRNETRKILGDPAIKISATCVRVPVVTTHSLAVHCRFRSRVDAEEARSILAATPGIRVEDEPARHRFPTPANTVGADDVSVGRIRRDLDDEQELEMFICGDNLRKGAALNTAQVAELLAG